MTAERLSNARRPKETAACAFVYAEAHDLRSASRNEAGDRRMIERPVRLDGPQFAEALSRELTHLSRSQGSARRYGEAGAGGTLNVRAGVRQIIEAHQHVRHSEGYDG